MPIVIKSAADIELMRAAGQAVSDVHSRMRELIAPGITTQELDDAAKELIDSIGGHPSFLGYFGYPASICASVGPEVVHGIPGNRELQEGEIISIDVGVQLNGFHGDSAATYPVGSVAPDLERLIADTEASFWAGFDAAIVGNRIGDISAAIQAIADARGCGIIREYGGHGIGRQMHEDPSVLNWGEAGKGAKLQPGMTLAIEPMLTLGGDEVVECEDGWTVVTKDGSAAAHYEHTVLITDDGPEALTWHR